MSGNKEKWSRPNSVPLPTVWRQCSGLRETPDGTVPEFRIQDVPEHMHEDIVNFMTTHFCRDEVTCACVRILEDPVSTAELQDIWRMMLKQNVSLVAIVGHNEEENPPKIAGCNIMGVSFKDENHTSDMFKGLRLRNISRFVLDLVSERVNMYEHYGVEEYMSALGLCVDPVFRCQGLGLELLKARFDLGKAVGLKATTTVFTAEASQRLAHKLGMEVLTEILYEDCKIDGKPAFPNIKGKSMKAMGKRIE
ncbi:hypothetical protein B7P43_G12512 [Cryptotermes secundus]|uniref:N-acetyltransferase domain-containing protein n=1 Tax=Cryptotermes secundus TaxID=105785 RepID=A0A2J7PU41_9NEOP|nr:uncharacterized protein LOC111871795 [Cryptotermes secundus]PNF19851.1 hypothetical protein B7P43_G12512 [Cryptotermes secundus]